uniref:Malonyl-coenzyme A:anthocyanin 3-O-glucoside-6''-O-malonyltransferase-like n=1 Tax=Tanacetum cinerariifolium TaxID=118510 RepID=A0A6L2NM16_TANCI|nr:malonyl-coenzyme A:anthocyanin 3-O-glucoside-6''-O-malonyltransferase-like [Tanacetum cinerariifolium]
MCIIFHDCKARLDPPIPEAYFGNCLWVCLIAAKTDHLTEKEGFVTAARLIGENLHKLLTDKDGILKEKEPIDDLNIDRMPTTIIGISGPPKIKLYELDFGWGKPKKIEKVSIDYSGSISIDACRESYEDMEIGVCLTDDEMQAFVRVFNEG